VRVYYNEFDPYCAQWLRNLMAEGLIPAGEVDDRDIRQVQPSDVRDFDQCHFFAGLGGWAYAFQLAEWSRPAWTGSCPCQPFSSAGKRRGFADERHLWPDWFRLIRECRPAVLFGEQVARAAVWLDAVFADLESEDYACGAAVLPACGVGAPHIRARAWFVADATGRDQRGRGLAERSGNAGELGNAEGDEQRRARLAEAGDRRTRAPGGSSTWRDLEWLPCTDGKARPVEPGTFPLAHGIPGRVGRLRAYGNAIVPQVAAEFIIAAQEVVN
jgi:DNA (cytosine-5)-methyltransferase 1